jgi:hypothetical protein
MITVIGTLQKFYNTTKFFKNITIKIMLKNPPHPTGYKLVIYKPKGCVCKTYLSFTLALK